MQKVPLVLFLSVTQIIGGGVGALVERKPLRLRPILQHLKQDWIYVLLLMINFFAYPYALRSAPAAHVDLIVYIWPSLLVCGELIKKRQRPSKLELFGMLMCFFAIPILLIPDLLDCQLKDVYFWGYIVAFLGTIAWAVYCLYSSHKQRYDHKKTPVDILIAGLFCGLWFLMFGPKYSIQPAIFAQMALFGVMVFGIAFPFWAKASRVDHPILLGSLANMIPILSIFWLVIGGVTELSFWLVLSFTLVSVGCLLIHVGERAGLQTGSEYNRV